MVLKKFKQDSLIKENNMHRKDFIVPEYVFRYKSIYFLKEMWNFRPEINRDKKSLKARDLF